jgi:hypothetical protein
LKPSDEHEKARFLNAIVEIELADNVQPHSFVEHVFGKYESRKSRFKIPILVLTNNRILFLQKDGTPFCWRVMFTSVEQREFDRAENERKRLGLPAHHKARPFMKHSAAMYLSPYWVLDAGFNEKLDRDFKEAVYPFVSNPDNLSALYKRSNESPYKFHEAWPGWMWVRECRMGKSRQFLLFSRPHLHFELGWVLAKQRGQSVVEHVGENAPKFAKTIARFFDKLQSANISYGEPAGKARLYLADAMELEKLRAELPQMPLDVPFTDKYVAALRAENESLTLRPSVPSSQVPPSGETGSAVRSQPSVSTTFFKVYSTILREWSRRVLVPVALLFLLFLILHQCGSSPSQRRGHGPNRSSLNFPMEPKGVSKARSVRIETSCQVEESQRALSAIWNPKIEIP